MIQLEKKGKHGRAEALKIAKSQVPEETFFTKFQQPQKKKNLQVFYERDEPFSARSYCYTKGSFQGNTEKPHEVKHNTKPRNNSCIAVNLRL